MRIVFFLNYRWYPFIIHQLTGSSENGVSNSKIRDEITGLFSFEQHVHMAHSSRLVVLFRSPPPHPLLNSYLINNSTECLGSNVG